MGFVAGMYGLSCIRRFLVDLKRHLTVIEWLAVDLFSFLNKYGGGYSKKGT